MQVQAHKRVSFKYNVDFVEKEEFAQAKSLSALEKYLNQMMEMFYPKTGMAIGFCLDAFNNEDFFCFFAEKSQADEKILGITALPSCSRAKLDGAPELLLQAPGREASGSAASLRKGVSLWVLGFSVTQYVMMGLNRTPPRALSILEESWFPSAPQLYSSSLWFHVGTILASGWILICSMCLPTWSS